ncbi:FtsX-like permease family protein [Mediterranea massiliensis]|uniref:FtsX-like permease family protein n=1 Tax=Mediterranea massiliensis TaxID=1841865 RepID=A0ABS2E059_9BACT|nr:FtsX-like permease family protein [Mediterranea massiliensis]MBM6735001.1 FtsX-like permease family protein [Mediterranea massiliensis]
MNKKLFTQIRNEWRSNLWLALELLVVSVVMWYIIDLLYCRMATYLEPRGFDTEHCYLINMGVLTDKSPDYTPYSDTHKQSDEVRELVERLRRRPEVEVVSLSLSAYPYNGSNGSAEVDYDTLHAPRWTIRRIATPDFVRVFRYQGARGETSEQLAEILERGDFLASDNLYRKYGVPMTSLVGKNEFHLFGDTTQTYRLGAALQNVRWDDYSQASTSYSMVYNMNLLPDDWINADNELCIRVRADRDQNFMENLKADSEKQFRIGNLYISDIKSFKDIRRSFQQGDTSQMRILVVGMGFLLLNIFLGLLGTFWFRTQQRRGEIALHKAMGATDGAVFGRLISEGIFLLLIVTVPAVIIDIVMAHFELNSWRNGTTLEWSRLAFCVAATFVLIAAMIGIGIGIPARRAMKVQPAEALHDE